MKENVLAKPMEITNKTTVGDIYLDVTSHAQIQPYKSIEVPEEKEPKNVYEAVSIALTSYMMRLSEAYKADPSALHKITAVAKMLKANGLSKKASERMTADILNDTEKTKAGITHTIVKGLMDAYAADTDGFTVPSLQDIGAEAVNTLYVLAETTLLPFTTYYMMLDTIHDSAAEIAVAVEQAVNERLRIIKEKVEVKPMDPNTIEGEACTVH